jgi:hypothetical protein
MPARRFPPPWSVEGQDACFVVPPLPAAVSGAKLRKIGVNKGTKNPHTGVIALGRTTSFTLDQPQMRLGV